MPPNQSRPTGAALPVSLRAGYATGSVITGTFGAVPALLLLPYLTNRLGVAAGTAGTIVLLPKLWDVILNPLAGRISDRAAGRGVPRRTFVLAGGLGVAVGLLLLFTGPTSPAGPAEVRVTLAFFACATAFAFFQVPFTAMPAEMTTEPRERTRLMTWRVAVVALAILVSGGLAPLVRDRHGYPGVGVFVAVLVGLGAVGTWWGTRHAPLAVRVPAGGRLVDQLRTAWRSRSYRSLLMVFVLQALGTGTMLAGVDYVAVAHLGGEGAATLLFVCFVGPAILCTPVWERVADSLGKRRGLVCATVLFGCGALLVLPALSLSRGVVAAAVALVGVAYAGIQMFPMSMLPDVAALDSWHAGQSRIGVYTGVWTAGETLGLATGPFLYSAVLAAAGFVSSTTGPVEQSAEAVRAISLGFTLLPATLVLLSLLPLRGYRLDERDVRVTAPRPGR